MNPNELLETLRGEIEAAEILMQQEDVDSIEYAERLDGIAVAFRELDDWLSYGGDAPTVWKK